MTKYMEYISQVIVQVTVKCKILGLCFHWNRGLGTKHYLTRLEHNHNSMLTMQSLHTISGLSLYSRSRRISASIDSLIAVLQACDKVTIKSNKLDECQLFVVLPSGRFQ